MLKTIYSTNDGEVSHPEEPVDIDPGTYMHITIEIIKPTKAKTGSFLQTARALKLDRSGRLVESYRGLPLRKQEWGDAE